jgi:hypothetical protein
MASLLDFFGSSPFAVPPGMDADPNEIARFAQGRGITGLAQGLLAASGPSRTPVSMGQAMGQGLLGFQQGQEQASDQMYKQGLLGLSVQKQRAEKEAAQREAEQRALIKAEIAKLPPEQQAIARLNPEGYASARAKQMFPENAGPLSGIAKLYADFQAGRIDEPTYKAALAKETHIAPSEFSGGGGMFPGKSVDAAALNDLVRRGVLTEQQAAEWAAGKVAAGPNGEISFVSPLNAFGGQPAPVAAPAAGGVATVADAAALAPAAGPPQPAPSGPTIIRPGAPPKEYGEKIAKMDNLDQAIADYEAALKETPPGFWGSVMGMPTAARAKLGTAHTALAVRLKELFELGALSGPDYGLMIKTLQDPTTAQGYALGVDGLLGQLGSVRKLAVGSRNTIMKQYGIKRPDNPDPQPTPNLKYNPDTGEFE